MEVIKRNGDIVKFNKEKIENAIARAMKNGSGIYVPEIAKLVAKDCEEHFQGETPTIFQIEEYVYDRLVHYGQSLTARAYEGYRAVQEYKREVNTTDESIMGLVACENEELMNENSNKKSTLASTQRDLIAGEISKDITRRKLLPAHIVQAHDEGAIHYHDMDYSIQNIFNCCLFNLEDMLQNGTVINDKMVEKPKSFATACTITTQIIAQVASGQYGGCSMTIKHLAPFLRVSKDKYVKKYTERYKEKFPQLTPDLLDELIKSEVEDRLKEELRAGIQTIRYQLSTLNTSNGQAAFVTIYLEIAEGDEYEEEMALICEEMLKQRIEGMKNERGQVISESFPKLVYALDEHNCLKGGKYDYITELAVESSIKRLSPDYQSTKIMRRNYEGGNFAPMG